MIQKCINSYRAIKLSPRVLGRPSIHHSVNAALSVRPHIMLSLYSALLKWKTCMKAELLLTGMIMLCLMRLFICI